MNWANVIPTKWQFLKMLSGSLLCVLVMAPLAREPDGSAIRPMGEAAQVGMIAMLWLAFGLWQLVLSCAQHRYVAGVVCMILGLLPLPLGIALLRMIVHWKGLTLKP